MTTTVGSSAEGTALVGVDDAVTLLRDRVSVFLTGAGVSTDSGIPDYRGEGAPKRSPMNVAQFLTDDAFRRRYWAGSHQGWKRFASSRPNDGHRAIARLESADLSTGVVTQNVDGLHVRAGSRRVVDLHGSMDQVRCLTCGQMFSRDSIAERMVEQNPGFDLDEEQELGPDGDVLVSGIDSFDVPSCTVCGGVLKPDIVFFGEYIPREKFEEATQMVAAAEVLVIAGSSLVVNSGIRLLEQARRSKKPVIIINRGITKGDTRAALKIDAGASQTLTAIADRLLGDSTVGS
ncbi:Sir2 family NAD-dependent protein deacetylase [Labedella endophytica]|uniref:protein acetyllysine N-acetyltransferase n=1 Tax=Labedella endophytica TaxID=1523160 RepID=A0A433JQP2_9MICO|nr:Sir2 family NAD-dependent protein deacetylase [Labedella endophytica]RUR00648.1 NAD-dependent deacetylase [Labedella endophytica]